MTVQVKEVIGEMQGVPDTAILELGPGAYVRLDFFDSELHFLGSRSVPPEGGTVGTWPGAAYWRVVVRMIKETGQ